MSYTSVYAVYKTKAVCLGELQNGHGSGPAIWDYIALKCTGERFDWGGASEAGAPFWKLWKDDRLSENEKAVLLSTYDVAFIEVDSLDKFAKACLEVHGKIISDTHWEWNHFAGIGALAEKLSGKHDHRCLGLGVGCTSVSDPWERWNFEQGKAWPVYAEINSL